MDTPAAVTAPVWVIAGTAEGRPINPANGEAPLRFDQVEEARMPRMCPELARLRLAWYAVSRVVVTIKDPTAEQLKEIERSRQSPAYQAAHRAYLNHFTACQTCREMVEKDPKENTEGTAK